MNPGFIFFMSEALIEMEGKDREEASTVPSVIIFFSLLFTLPSPRNVFKASGSLRSEYAFSSNSIENGMTSLGSPAVRGYPCGDRGQVFGFLAQVVFHCEVNKVDCWFGCYEGHLFIQGTD